MPLRGKNVKNSSRVEDHKHQMSCSLGKQREAEQLKSYHTPSGTLKLLCVIVCFHSLSTSHVRQEAVTQTFLQNKPKFNFSLNSYLLQHLPPLYTPPSLHLSSAVAAVTVVMVN